MGDYHEVTIERGMRRYFILIVLLALPAATASSTPPLQETCVRPADRKTVVHFRSTDGVRLAGALVGRGPVGVVLAHQLGADLCQWMPFARILARSGYRALPFDFRGYGSSQDVDVNLHGDRDVAGAAAELRRRGVKKVFVMGASMGGTAVVAAAAKIRPLVRGVVDLSGPTTFTDVNALAAAPGLRCPALFLAARYDQPFADSTRALFRAAGSRDKRLVIVSGAHHGVLLLLTEARRALVLTFIRGHA
jgi:pimeloyl-ACP methyl ester carboxylesterase